MGNASNATQVQSILFEKAKWRPHGARKWLIEHGKKFRNMESTETHLRFRQVHPKNFDPDTFRTIHLGNVEEGIKAIIGTPLRINPKDTIKTVSAEPGEQILIQWRK